jgi:hypothetical protein
MDYEEDLFEIRGIMKDLSKRIIETINSNDDIGEYIAMYAATNEALTTAVTVIDTVMAMAPIEDEDNESE